MQSEANIKRNTSAQQSQTRFRIKVKALLKHNADKTEGKVYETEMKYVFKEECKTMLVAALGHTKSYIHFRLQSEINLGMAERCHNQCTLQHFCMWFQNGRVEAVCCKGVEESKVAEEIVVQCMTVDISRKQQKYTHIGAQE